MYTIIGDGSYQHTKVTKDGVPLEYKRLLITVNEQECLAYVDGVEGAIDRMILSGIYSIISMGAFSNTKILFCDEMLRGVQEIYINITFNYHPILEIKTIFLPNIVETLDKGGTNGV